MDLNQKNLKRRARIISLTREFFNSNGYLEVETPVRIPVPLPEAHIEPFESEGWVLQPSPELCMKRLLACGCERIFQVCKCFRKGERGGRHLPEMTMLEWYAVGETYADLMQRTEELLLHIARGLGMGETLNYRGQRVDLRPPWPRLTVAEAFARHASVSMQAALDQGRFDEVVGLEIETHFGLDRPVFICDYPAACGALARLKPGDPGVAERFELYIGGLELCNGFSELTDPIEQRRRFAFELAKKSSGGGTRRALPEKFLDALESLPPCAGNALGIDRLVMVFTDATRIDEVVAFTPEDL